MTRLALQSLCAPGLSLATCRCCLSVDACCCSKDLVSELQADLRQAQDAGMAAAGQLAVVSKDNSQLQSQLQQSVIHRQAHKLTLCVQKQCESAVQVKLFTCLFADDQQWFCFVCMAGHMTGVN